jgi:hypothetical protein
MGRSKKSNVVSPGEGERRALRGLIPQYEIAASLIYDALAAGTLRWIGVADRKARKFDDCVLGLQDRVVGHQVKTSASPKAVSLPTLLLGSTQLIKSLAEGWQALHLADDGRPAELRYLCDDHFRLDDAVTDDGTAGRSSAAFIRTHLANKSTWTAQDWTTSPFAPFIEQLKTLSGLSDDLFWHFFKSFEIVGSGVWRPSHHFSSRRDAQLRAEIATLLPRLVADKADKDRWTATELLEQLNWRDPFAPMYRHAFPIDALVQANEVTQFHLSTALQTYLKGYIALVGPPGSGKSTLLQTGLLPTPAANVLRYVAYVPGEGQRLGRGEAHSFLYDLVVQLKGLGFGAASVPAQNIVDLRTQLNDMLQEAGVRFGATGVRSIFIVDGLDHVPREEKPDRSFLRELPPPSALPDGVLFILGTQRLDLEDIPPTVRDEANATGRSISVAALPRDAVFKMADLAGLPQDVDRDLIFERSAGHPLALRYLVERLRTVGTSDEQNAFLANEPAYGGDVEAIYARAWRDIEGDESAKKALAFVALAEGSLRPDMLDGLVGTEATDKAWSCAAHLLHRDKNDGWSVFHNSFRLFLQEKTGQRFGKPDAAATTKRHCELAAAAAVARPDDPQRWLELRYFARAQDDSSVLRLAQPARFRKQLAEGRSPQAIRDDIKLAFQSVERSRDASKLMELLLSRHEVEMRSGALGVDELIDAYISIGALDTAVGLLANGDAHLSVEKAYDVVDALLASGRTAEARTLFEQHQPLEKLLGSKPLDGTTSDHDLYDWAERALVFYPPETVLTSIDRLTHDQSRDFGHFDIDQFRSNLRFVAARSSVRANPKTDIDAIIASLKVHPDARPQLVLAAAITAVDENSPEVALQHFNALAAKPDVLSDQERRRAAGLLMRLGQPNLARTFMQALEAPAFSDDLVHSTDDITAECLDVFQHASLIAALELNPQSATPPKNSLFRHLQAHLTNLGRLHGIGRAKGASEAAETRQAVKALLIFLRSAADDQDGGSRRWQLDKALGFCANYVIVTARLHGADTFGSTVEEIDAALDGASGPLGYRAFRYSFAMAVYRIDRDAGQAVRRLTWNGAFKGHSTPSEHIEAVAEAAISLCAVGARDQAAALLAGIHQQGLGYALAARKDPQFALWRDLLLRVCKDDPAGNAERIAFMTKLMDGMSDTEGSNAAGRVTRTILEEAAATDASLAWRTAEQLKSSGLASWKKTIAALTVGVARADPKLAPAAAIVFGRIGLPFCSELSEVPYAEFIRIADEADLPRFVKHAVDCVKVDARTDVRFELLAQIATEVRQRGVEIDIEGMSHWRSEHVPSRRSSTDDSWLETVHSLDDLRTYLSTTSPATASYEIVRAVERLATHVDYDQLCSLVTSETSVGNDGRVKFALALAAIKSGRMEDARAFAVAMRDEAQAKGSWGEYQDGGKIRWHRIMTQLDGQKARQNAFTAFAHDLSQGREWTFSLLPDLCDVLELCEPRPSWPQAWSLLSEHLEQFREFELGRPAEVEPLTGGTSQDLLARLILRAYETTVTELAPRARVAIAELVIDPASQVIVTNVLTALCTRVGDFALEAARIAWSCQDSAVVRNTVEPYLIQWSGSRDLALQISAARLAKVWGIALQPITIPAPAIYSVIIPEEDRSEKFDKPLGYSDVDNGIWSDDPFAWTWGLKQTMKLLEDATPYSITQLRRRTAQFMGQFGGRSAFGPDAVKGVRIELERYDLRVTFRRLMAAAALRAARESIGELRLAGQLDPQAVGFMLNETGGFAFGATKNRLVPRPDKLPIPRLPEASSSSATAVWLDRAADDAICLIVTDGVCIASACRFKSTSRESSVIVERLTLPSLIPDGYEGIDSLLHGGSRVWLHDYCEPLYRGIAPGGIASVDPDAAGSVRDCTLALCPNLARALKLRPSRFDGCSYEDQEGRVVVRTIWWSEGGVRTDDIDRRHFGDGSMVLVAPSLLPALKRHIGTELTTVAWRRVESRGKDKRSEFRIGSVVGRL